MDDDSKAEMVMMKREIDSLQIAINGPPKPWYRNTSTIISVIALLFSFGTTYVSYKRTEAQDIQGERQELRGLLQRLAALPKENIEMQKKYDGDPVSINAISGFINQENLLLAKQAAELAKKLPQNVVTGPEYYAIAVALQNAYELTGAEEFLKFSLDAAKDFDTEISALRSTAMLHFIQGHPETGRVEFQKALSIFSKYPGYDQYTQASTNIWTELSWSQAELGVGALSSARQHLESARGQVDALPRGAGASMLDAQVAQAELQFSGSQGGGPPALGHAAPPKQPAPFQ